MSLSREDLRPERTMDVIETAEKLHGEQYADRLRFAVNIFGLVAQCELAVAAGNRNTAAITATLAVSLLADQLPHVLGVSAKDIFAACTAQKSDTADIAAKLRQEFGK